MHAVLIATVIGGTVMLSLFAQAFATRREATFERETGRLPVSRRE
jgi:hypothetical protein